jgi:menaquinone-dependent protoporphyrinogen oxidase
MVLRNKPILSIRPLWLFNSGPIGKKKVDAKGRGLLDPLVSGPNELEELKKVIHPRDHRIFFGAFDAKNVV